MIVFIILLALECGYVAAKGGLRGVARDRKYKSGTGWCYWRWTDVESEYILRLHVLKTPWFAVCLHWINKPDREPWLHDHPVSFLSLILRGGYAEFRRRGDEETRAFVHRWFNFIRASENDRHRIMFVRKNTLTLCFMGPKTREWGFHINGTWTYWKHYYEMLKNGVDVRKEQEPVAVRSDGARDGSVFRVDDGRITDGWYWCDETWAPSGPYGTREAAVNAQAAYIVEVLGV